MSASQQSSYQEQIMHFAASNKTLTECFYLWKELLFDIVKQQRVLSANAEFLKSDAQQWQQSSDQQYEQYFSPERAKLGAIQNQDAEQVYMMGCILYETIFWKTLWRTKKIRNVEGFMSYCNTYDSFQIEEYKPSDYVSKGKGESTNEVAFIFDLLASMLHHDANERPASLSLIASWLEHKAYSSGNAQVYYIQQDVSDSDPTPYLGIDLGTTNTVVVLAKEGQLTELRIDDALTIPSAVFYEDEETCYFGKQALSRSVNYPQSLATSFKRHMQGVDGHYPQLKYAASNTAVDATGMSIAQTFLTWIREQAMKVAKEPLNHVVITVPADFDSRKIDSTRRAALGAGFTHVGIEREPNAAGYAYLHAERMTFNGEKNIFVYDFGGGTFDVSVLQRTGEQSFEIIGRDGDEKLGGDLFNEEIMKWIVAKVREQYYDFTLDDAFNYLDERHFYNAKRIIREAAKEAKHALSTQHEFTIKLRQLPINDELIVPVVIEFSREDFEPLVAPFIKQAERAIDRALAQAKVEKRIDLHEIDDVVLAGGTALTPSVKQSVENYFGKLSNKALNMSTMIARGAALFAMLKWTNNKEQSIIQQAAINKVTHDFGVAIAVEGSRHLAFKMLVPTGVELPCKESASFYTEKDNQQSLQIIIARRSVHEREEALFFNHEGIEVIDKIWIENLPQALAGELNIDVMFKFDGIGNLSITVQIMNRQGQVLQEQDLVKQVELL